MRAPCLPPQGAGPVKIPHDVAAYVSRRAVSPFVATGLACAASAGWKAVAYADAYPVAYLPRRLRSGL